MEVNAELKREKSKQKRKAQDKRRKIEKETGEVNAKLPNMQNALLNNIIILLTLP